MIVHLVTIWYSVRYECYDFSNHRKQNDLGLSWPVCTKFNMAATWKNDCQIVTIISTRTS